MTDKIEWCIVKLGEDLKWWIAKLSNDTHDINDMSIIDPKQFDYIKELLSPLQEYGLRKDILEKAFLKFRINSIIANSQVKLEFVTEKALDSEEPLFLLPNVGPDNEGPYSEFIDHIIALRIKLLNDTIDFKSPMKEEEIEESMREIYQEKFISGNVMHAFDEIIDVLEYAPAGYDIAQQNEYDDESVHAEDELIGINDEHLDNEEIEEWEDTNLQKLDMIEQ